MKDLSITKAEWESSRIDSVLEIEKLEPDDMESFVRDFLLPNLQHSYNHVKEYISNNTRKNIYTIKKQLADLIENQEVVRISTSEAFESTNISKFGASYLILESLNDIYLFSSIMKSKIPTCDANTKLLFTLGKLSKEICTLQKEIRESLEQQARSCLRI
ncbi:hypothetical protein [Acetivibrio cellulolyticus]|uniref:hypothetical protein n=1 Tax=Acetivibrio cellulolyticus TaxID=35830 RepID=UPI0001E2CBAC|nr:hypothetical protein [Acetivibrio cellulolyticus]